MYAIIPQQIPQDRRAESQREDPFRHRLRQGPRSDGKHLQLLHGNRRTAQPQTVGLSPATMSTPRPRRNSRWDSSSPRTTYAEDMVETLSPTSAEMVLDMCCGMGNFFNHLPNLHNAYGFDIDGKAVAVAQIPLPGSPYREMRHPAVQSGTTFRHHCRKSAFQPEI